MLNKVKTFFAGFKPLGDSGSLVWQVRMLDLHNAQRVSSRPALSTNLKLQDAAQKHASWMASTGILSHTGENGSSMEDRVNAEHYPWTMLGENIAYGPTTCESVVQLWMSSYGHRMNILNGDYAQVGFGMAKAGDGVVYWSADFGRPR